MTTPFQRWSFLGVISLGLLMIGIDNSILYTALPELREQLDMTETQGLWIINAYPLVLAGLLLGTGTLGDRIGHRRMFLTGLVLFGIASLAAAFSPDAWSLIAARAALGLGAAVMMPATLALIRITFTDERERNTAIGVWGSVAVIGAAVGPVVGGLLLEFFWWGSIFLINVPIVLVALVATVLIAPPNMPNPAKRWDAVSSVYALLTLSGLVMAIKEAAHPDRTWWLLAAAVVVCLLAGLAFARRQQRLTDPLLTFDVFRSRIFTGGVLAAGGAMFAVAGLELMTTQRFQIVEGYSPLDAGLLIIAVTVTAFPFSILSGAFLHRLGFIPLIAGGFIAVTVGIGLALWFGSADVIPGFIGALALVGAGAGSIMSVASTAIVGSAPAHRAGMAAGVEEVSYEFGTLVSVAILGSLLPVLQLATGSYDSAYFRILAILAGAAAVLAVISAYCFRGNPKGARVAHQ